MNPEAAVVLSVEDNPDSTMEVVEHLRMQGATVIQSESADAAERVIRVRNVDYILLDLRVPRTGRDPLRGGVTFIKDLKSGRLGPLNRDTPFLVLTSFIHEVSLDEVREVPDFIAPVFAKAAVMPEEIESSLDLDVDPERSASQYFLDSLLQIDSAPTDGTVHFSAPAWPGEGRAAVPVDELPDEIREELGYNVFPVYVWARINVDAATTLELMPSEFRICLIDEGHDEAFDGPLLAPSGPQA
jgi:CheY-like chemotaxis protein